MLKLGAVKRVDRAVRSQLEPDESLQTSVLGYVMGRGDFAIGLTNHRLLWVGVTKVTGKANGKILSDAIAQVRMGDPRFTHIPIIRSDGSTLKVKVDRMWAARLQPIVDRLNANSSYTA